MKKKKLTNLTKKMAEEIRDYRYKKENCSWRMVATKFSEAHPEYDLCSGNQIEGMELCKAAMSVLGEDWEDGWN